MKSRECSGSRATLGGLAGELLGDLAHQLDRDREHLLVVEALRDEVAVQRADQDPHRPFALGFVGFGVFSLCGLLVFVLLGAAWQVLLAGPDVPRLAVLIRARLVRDAAAEVLPLSQLGGIALGVRAAILQGLAAPLAAASMIVDVTTEMVAQIAYAALGVAILVARAPQDSHVASFVAASLIGCPF